MQEMLNLIKNTQECVFAIVFQEVKHQLLVIYFIHNEAVEFSDDSPLPALDTLFNHIYPSNAEAN